MSSKDTITKEYMSKRPYFADALNYGQQVSEIASEHRKEKDLRDTEFLSGFSKEDKIIPVITLTVYFGSDKWDGLWKKCVVQLVHRYKNMKKQRNG